MERNEAANYMCEVCGATFKDADALTKHMQIHESGKGDEAKKPLEQGLHDPTQSPGLTPGGPPTL